MPTKIRRGIKPAVFEIYHNGKVKNQDAKSTYYQKYLEEKVLKLNFKSLLQRIFQYRRRKNNYRIYGSWQLNQHRKIYFRLLFLLK